MKKNMNYKKIVFIIITIIVVMTCGFILKNIIDSNNDIPNDYIAIFHGGVGEQTYKTYIYKIDNGHANYGFKYINVTSTTESWGSSNIKNKITGRGKFDWTDRAFTVAKENGAYSYITLPGDDKIYTIEEFKKRFIVD